MCGWVVGGGAGRDGDRWGRDEPVHAVLDGQARGWSVALLLECPAVFSAAGNACATEHGCMQWMAVHGGNPCVGLTAGGKRGFDKVTWRVQSEEPGTSVTLRHTSADGDEVRWG